MVPVRIVPSACAVHLQAMISGAFSIVKQSIALGCFPRLDIKHTSEKFGGQIYIPAVNWTLMVLTVAVVAGFQSGTAIGNGRVTCHCPPVPLASCLHVVATTTF